MRTAIPIVTEQQAAEMIRVEEQRKETQDKQQPPEVEILIEANTLEELEAILKKREDELLGYVITKENIESELNAFRSAWIEANDNMQCAKQQRQQQSQSPWKEATTSTPRRKSCGKRQPRKFREQAEMEEREMKKKNFISQAPPWGAATPPLPPPITNKKRKWRPRTVHYMRLENIKRAQIPLYLKHPSHN